MNSRERMRAALSGQAVDRVPFFPCIFVDHACHALGREFAEAIVDPRVGVRAMLDANVLYGSDVVRMFTVPPRAWFEEKEVRQQGHQLVQVDRRSGAVDGSFDLQGGGSLIPAEPEERVETLEQADAITFPSAEELLDTGCLDAVRNVTAEAHDRGMFVVGMAGAQTLNGLAARRGGQEALITLVDQPELARRIMARATDASIEVGNAFARIGVDALYIGDSWASGSVISPQMYEEFCVPLYDRATAAAHANGLLVYKHCCGNYDPLLSVLKTECLDGMEGIDPTNGMSVARTRDALGDAMCMIGGVSCLSLLQGTADQVYAEACECIRQGGTDGRFVLGSACAVPRFSPPANLHAMARAAAKATATGTKASA